MLDYLELLINNFCHVDGEEETQSGCSSSEAHLEPLTVQSPTHKAAHMFAKRSFPTSTEDPRSLCSWLSLWKPDLCSPPVTLDHEQVFRDGLCWAQSLDGHLGWIFSEGASYLREQRAAQSHLRYLGKCKDQNPLKLWPQFVFLMSVKLTSRHAILKIIWNFEDPRPFSSWRKWQF